MSTLSYEFVVKFDGASWAAATPTFWYRLAQFWRLLELAKQERAS